MLSDVGEMWQIWQTSVAGPWSDWASMGSAGVGFSDHPAAARSADGRLELFVRGADNALWHASQTIASNGWSDWASLGSAGGGFLDHPVVAPSADGRLEVFIVGLDHSLWHIWQTVAASNTWSNWYSHGFAGNGFGTGPAIGTEGDGRLDVFVTGNDGSLYQIGQTVASNGWSGWLAHGQP